ncbi:death-associated protein 1 homolog [Lethenteron reissneri]|uniref:death-associated protein 1 homolog n=1 Tax=Lethenteron reissneri TaxID=7753 RepID=UPI002AB5E8E6|nr:death-associated protein 1 homolog [Lethenteron reissneri]XP_061403884.1 death-associated protein 1 homolog [Lethenteron reissneri]XP_061403886.1 death-associated protein 1 homolog [Lethenteron reissneri]
MASPPKEHPDLKGGHLPAVRAGGMRIVQKHHPGAPAAPVPSKPDEHGEEEEEEEETPAPPAPKPPVVVVSGAIARGDKDFPPEAVKVAHEKPQPKVERNWAAPHVNAHIQQPRK